MYDQNNIFAKIIRGELECDKVYEDEQILAFNDIKLDAPVHILVIPKGQYSCFAEFVQLACEQQISYFFKKIQEIAASSPRLNKGYRLITNNKEYGGQVIDHFHVHILGGMKLS